MNLSGAFPIGTVPYANGVILGGTDQEKTVKGEADGLNPTSVTFQAEETHSVTWIPQPNSLIP